MPLAADLYLPACLPPPQDPNDEADGGSSLSASVGMQLEPATYCPPSTSLQPIFNPDTSTYDFPSLSPPTTRRRTTAASSSSPLLLKDGYYTRRPCAVVAGVLPGSPAEEAGIKLGDRVVKIGRVVTENAAGWDTTDGQFENTLLKGSEGSTIRVEVVRQDSQDKR